MSAKLVSPQTIGSSTVRHRVYACRGELSASGTLVPARVETPRNLTPPDALRRPMKDGFVRGKQTIRGFHSPFDSRFDLPSNSDRYSIAVDAWRAMEQFEGHICIVFPPLYETKTRF